VKNSPILRCNLPAPTLRGAAPYLWYSGTGLLILVLGLCFWVGWSLAQSSEVSRPLGEQRDFRDPHFIFRFAENRIIARFHLDGIEAGRMVTVLKLG
jgi:hypothetical protein